MRLRRASGRGRSRFRRRVGVAIALSLLLLAQSGDPALAEQSDGVHVDPGSPAGYEYAIPLSQARNAGGGAGGASKGLFGAGIRRVSQRPGSESRGRNTTPGAGPGKRAGHAAAPGSTRRTSGPGPSSRSRGVRTRAAIPDLRQVFGSRNASGLESMLLSAAVVVMAGVGASRILTRRRQRPVR
jgi:hypothetical protein